MPAQGAEPKATAVEADSIGHLRLARAHAFATNAKALAEGKAAQKLKELVAAAEKLDNSKLRLEIGMMVDAAKFKITTIQLDTLQNNVLAHIRMTRQQVTRGKPDRSLDDIRETIRKQRKAGKLDIVADMREQVDAIHSVLRAP